MHPFSTPLKTLENRKDFWCFQGIEKGCIGKKWVKEIHHLQTFQAPRQQICKNELVLSCFSRISPRFLEVLQVENVCKIFRTAIFQKHLHVFSFFRGTSKFSLRRDVLIFVQNFTLKSHLRFSNVMISTFTNSSVDIVSKHACLC